MREPADAAIGFHREDIIGRVAALADYAEMPSARPDGDEEYPTEGLSGGRRCTRCEPGRCCENRGRGLY
jgi:hypothetical protein